MAIEFPCPQCNQMLRVGDDSAGKTAKCPKCLGLAKIPAASGGNPAASRFMRLIGVVTFIALSALRHSVPQPALPIAGSSEGTV